MGPRFQDPAGLSTSEGLGLIQDAVARPRVPSPAGLERQPDVGPARRHLLEPGQGVLLVTDGVVERPDHDILARLDDFAALVAKQGDQGLEALADAVVEEYCQASEDDCCIVAIRGDPPGTETGR
jgi:hypothetical protein